MLEVKCEKFGCS